MHAHAGRWSGRYLGWSLLALTGCSIAASKPAQGAAEQRSHLPTESVLLCAGTVTEFEIHRCIWQLTPEQQRHRPHSQRLVFVSGQLTRLDNISGSGVVIKGEGSTTFSYRDGRVRATTWLKQGGAVEGGSEYSEDGHMVLWHDSLGRPKPKKASKASGLVRKLDVRGRVLSYVYVDDAGHPTPFDKVYEVRVERNQRGAIVRERYFGEHGEPVIGPAGAHDVEHRPDDHDFDVEVRYRDAAGAPTLAHGVHSVRMKADAFGNELERAFFDVEGKPVVSSELGAASVRYTRDAHGNELGRELFDADGRPVVGAAGFASRQRRFDERDLPIEWRFFGADGAPIRLKDTGCPLMRQTRDAHGNVVTERFYDENAVPMSGKEGYHRVEIGYDARDNPTSYRYTDVAGTPVMNSSHYHEKTLVYDAERLVRAEFLDVDGKPTMNDKDYAAYEVSYAPDGSELEKKYFDANGTEQQSCKGYLDAEAQTALTERAAATKSCYEQALGRDREAAGALMVALRLSSDGQVLKARLESSEWASPDSAFADCVLSTLHHPYPVGAKGADCADVRIPLRFRPKSAP